jgi:WD40 repeat protein
MLWISNKKSSYIPENLPQSLNASLIDKKSYFKQLTIKEFCRNFSFYNSEDILENYIDEEQSIIIIYDILNPKKVINIYAMEIYDNKICNFFLHHQKKTNSGITCIDIKNNNTKEYQLGTLFATGSENGEVNIWQVEENEFDEPQNVFHECIFKTIQNHTESVIKIKYNHKYNLSYINHLCWNKMNTNIITSCSKNGLINFIDLNVGNSYKLFKCKESEPLYISFNPFNRFEYVALLKNSSYFIADYRYKKNVAYVKSKNHLKTVNWIFSENFFFESEKNGFISLLDKRYLTKSNYANYLSRKKGVSGELIDVNLCNQYKKLALLNKKGSIVIWEVEQYRKVFDKKSLAITKKNAKKTIWSPLRYNHNVLLALNDDRSVSLVF